MGTSLVGTAASARQRLRASWRWRSTAATKSARKSDPRPSLAESCTEIRAGNAVDVIEIDAATNRGIDEIRELRDAARYRPARDRYKIYILDEAHQITDAAFNALLKTLEEPPDHIVFMMATTQPEDIPQTIRSRCQHFSFHAVKFDGILAQLRAIAAQEQITADEAALALLAEAGDGSMRDALSIMDQAIASAPVTDDRPHLDAQQILDLMGNVPNTVFERLMEAISENQSAAVLEEINRLLNAGNSPAQLARQFVRYLRNCLMARLAGESTELLQISPDERARAARSSVLFSEEDLTRFLDVMLRTFDQLNYRQEQRFHLELGLMKLVHLQRLLPVEHLLSRLPTPAKSSPGGGGPLPGGGGKSTSSPVAPALPSASPRAAVEMREPAVPFSPFQSDRNRKIGESTPRIDPPAATPAPSMATPVSAPRLPTPWEAASQAVNVDLKPGSITAAVASAETIASSAAVATLEEPSLPASASLDLDSIRDRICDALNAGGHDTASALLSNGVWSETDGKVRVEVPIKKTMLGLTMNAEAEKIVKSAARETGFTGSVSVVSAANGSEESNRAAPPAKRPAPAGSLQAEALAHPMVKRALELFDGEVRSVLDLREKKNA